MEIKSRQRISLRNKYVILEQQRKFGQTWKIVEASKRIPTTIIGDMSTEGIAILLSHGYQVIINPVDKINTEDLRTTGHNL